MSVRVMASLMQGLLSPRARVTLRYAITSGRRKIEKSRSAGRKRRESRIIVRTILLITAAFFLISIASGLTAAEWHVDSSVAQSGDGKSWVTALKTIQEGIDAALDGDTVIVAEGTYVENIYFKGKNIILRSRDSLNPLVVENTRIVGNKNGSVVSFSGTENATCILSGFTITNGKVDYGAGILGGWEPHHTYATIQNNTIAENRADGRLGFVASKLGNRMKSPTLLFNRSNGVIAQACLSKASTPGAFSNELHVEPAARSLRRRAPPK